MGRFSYKAVDKDGRHITGSLEAVDPKSAVAGLAGVGQFVVEIAKEADGLARPGEKAWANLARYVKFGGGRISGKDILAFTAQLSTALQAGLPLLNAMEIICEQQHKPAMKKLLEKVVASVSSGQSLSDAMAGYEDVFSPMYCSMIRVGETGGILDQTTAQLAKILDREEKIKTNIKNASAYPIFVLCVGLVSVTIVITWILPRILATISGGISVLPWPTRVLMAMSDLIKLYGWLIFIIVAAGLYYLRKWKKSQGRIKWDTFKLKLPVVGPVLLSIAVGRFTRMFGSLISGGVTVLEALGVLRDTLGNEVLGREIDNVAEKVKTGAPLAGPLASSGYFPPLLVQIVSLGEQTGKLDELLLGAADTFDSEADAAISKFVAILPAALILVLALVMGFIIAAILLPIVTMELGEGRF